MFEPTTVRYTGKRTTNLIYHIYVGGRLYNAQGYIFSAGRMATMTKAEADVLLGHTKPEVNETTGAVVTGFVVRANLGKDGLVHETWELVQPNAPKQTEVAPTT